MSGYGNGGRRWHRTKHCPACGRIRSNHYEMYCCRPGCQLVRKRRMEAIRTEFMKLKKEGKV